MQAFDQRAALERLIIERREDYSALSRLLGRNAAYVQQFIKRGIPRRLAEDDRRTLAAYFGVDESVLGGPSPAQRPDGAAGLIAIPRLDVGASAGPGALEPADQIVSHMAFSRQWLRRLCGGRPEDLSIIRVEGDSMAPTLADGDEIMVDRGDAATRLRDGIYVLRREEELLVKRVAVNPATGAVTVKSDNPAYPVWPDCPPDALTVLGRVVWAAGRVS
jgi:hypothetical protein